MLISLNFLYLKKEKNKKKKDEEKELPQIFCNQMGFYYLNAVMEVVPVCWRVSVAINALKLPNGF